MSAAAPDACEVLEARFPGARISYDVDRFVRTGLWGAEVRVELADGRYVRVTGIAPTKEGACEMVAWALGATLATEVSL